MTERHQFKKGWVCPLCKLARGPDYHDPCIRNLPGVKYGCCGHGGHGDTQGYLYFENGVCIHFNVTSISYDDDRPRINVPGDVHGETAPGKN